MLHDIADRHGDNLQQRLQSALSNDSTFRSFFTSCTGFLCDVVFRTSEQCEQLGSAVLGLLQSRFTNRLYDVAGPKYETVSQPSFVSRTSNSGSLTLHGQIKPQNNGNTVTGTLGVDRWAVTFGTARRGLSGLAAARLVPTALYQM